LHHFCDAYRFSPHDYLRKFSGLIGLRLSGELDEGTEKIVFVVVIVITGGTKEGQQVSFMVDGPEGSGDESQEEEYETGDGTLGS